MQELSNYMDSIKLLIAGLLGAMVAARYNKSEINGRMDYIAFVLSGTVISAYLSEPVAGYFNLGPEMVGAAGFLLGAFGGSLINAGLKAIGAADLWQVVLGKLGLRK